MADLNTNPDNGATGGAEDTTGAAGTTGGTDGGDQQPTVEELLTRIAKQEADYAKLKAANDKATSEASDLKKQLRARQTAQEQADAAKAEAEEQHKQYVDDLEKFRSQALAKDRYLAQGMDAATAAKAAEAEIGGDMDALSSIQKQFTESLIKTREAEWRKSIPDPQAGVGDSAITKEQFDAMGIAERTKLFRENRAEYDRLMKL